ncbi:MAG TPA: hypothetical protein VK734_13215 [Bradyrhizobium sp.]|nr:hypothetical protein [Bradyrhizobium sp.]
MTPGFSAVNKLALTLAAGALIAVSLAGSASAQAPQYDKRGRPVYGGGPNVVYQQGPHTRIYVSKRSWLDGGTEVLPGDRKFTDYAYPPELGYPSFARENNNRPIDRQPLNPPSDLGGYPRGFPLY